MNLLSFDTAAFMAFALILTRVGVIVAMVPILGSRLVPSQVKICLVMGLSYYLYTVVRPDVSILPTDLVMFGPLILAEALLGLALMLLIRVIFAGVQLAGQMIGYQMGMAIANVIDPQTGDQQSITAELAYILATFLFLAFNGHWLIIQGLIDSFAAAPPGFVAFGPRAIEMVLSQGATLFLIGIKIGAAPFVVLFFAKVAMGIVAKTVPQMNVLFVGMPLYLMIGLFLFGISLRLFAPIISSSLAGLNRDIAVLYRLVGP